MVGPLGNHYLNELLIEVISSVIKHTLTSSPGMKNVVMSLSSLLAAALSRVELCVLPPMPLRDTEGLIS